jgi:hypothetical protein
MKQLVDATQHAHFPKRKAHRLEDGGEPRRHFVFFSDPNVFGVIGRLGGG